MLLLPRVIFEDSYIKSYTYIRMARIHNSKKLDRKAVRESHQLLMDTFHILQDHPGCVINESISTLFFPSAHCSKKLLKRLKYTILMLGLLAEKHGWARVVCLFFFDRHNPIVLFSPKKIENNTNLANYCNHILF